MNREQRKEALSWRILDALLKESHRGSKASTEAYRILLRGCPQERLPENHFVHFQVFVWYRVWIS